MSPQSDPPERQIAGQETPDTSDNLEGPLLPWSAVRREAMRATRRTWPALLGVPFALAVIAGIVQWWLSGHNEKAWDAVTGSAFAASLITFTVAILLVIVVEVALAPLAVARETLKLRNDEVRQLRTRIEREAEPPTPLEERLRQRTDEAGQLARQRSVRGDRWYHDAMSEWDTANVQQMALMTPR